MSDRAAQVKRRGARIMKLVEAIGEDPQDEGVFKLVECGLHSGFPSCCIEFFVRAYWPIMMLNDAELRDARKSSQGAIVLSAIEQHRTTLFQRDDVTPGYVPCPRCLDARRFVKVRRCDWHLTARERRRILSAGPSGVR